MKTSAFCGKKSSVSLWMGGSLKLRVIFKVFSVFGSVLFGVSLYAQQWALQDGHPRGSSVLALVARTPAWPVTQLCFLQVSSREKKSNQEAWVRRDPAQTVQLSAHPQYAKDISHAEKIFQRDFSVYTYPPVNICQSCLTSCGAGEFAITHSLVVNISRYRRTLLEGPGLISAGFQCGSYHTQSL